MSILLPLLATATQPSTQAASPTPDLDWFMIILQLFGGLAMFLLGMDMLAAALKIVAGERMKWLLAKLTTNRFMGVISGAIVTGVLQSSSVTTVLLVGFVSAGLMTLAQAIGVILGANIGSTFTAQIIAFKVTHYAYIAVALGYLLMLLGKKDKIKQYGRLIVGLGLLFVGMNVMSGGMRPLRDAPVFMDLMMQINNPFLAILIGAAFTALIQSSAVTTGIVIIMATQGMMDLNTAIAITLGANIGTCVTAMLASIGKTREAVRAAIIHVMFNLIGALIWIAFIPLLAQLVQGYGDIARQIANAHTLFNVINMLLFLPFVGVMAWSVKKILPDPLTDAAQPIEVRKQNTTLDPSLITTPSLALAAARKEIARLADLVTNTFNYSLDEVLSGEEEGLETLRNRDEAIDQLHAQIITYLSRVSEEEIDKEQTEILRHLMEAANGLEHIGDVIETDLVDAGMKRLETGFQISDATTTIMGRYHEAVCKTLKRTTRAIDEANAELARKVRKKKKLIKSLNQEVADHQRLRLNADAPHRLEAYTMEIEVMQHYRRIYDSTRRICRHFE